MRLQVREISWLLATSTSITVAACAEASAFELFSVPDLNSSLAESNLLWADEFQYKVEESRDGASMSWSRPSTPDDAAINLDFSVANEGDQPPPFSTLVEEGEDQLRQLMSMTGAVEYSNLVSFNFSNRIEERFDWTLSNNFFPDEKDYGTVEGNQLISTEMSLGLLGDRIQLTRKVSWSHFNGSSEYDGSIGNNASVDFSDKTGVASLEQIDLTLWKSDFASLSIFGLHNSVNQFYQTFENKNEKEKDKPDLLEVPNQETYKYGANLGVGPIAFSLGEFWAKKLEADDDGAVLPSEHGYDGGISLDLVDLRARTSGYDDGKIFWSIAPTSLWINYSQSAVNFELDGDTPEDVKSDVSFGGTWSWGGAYGNVSYWRSLYDNHQTGEEDADWSGDGIDIGAGFSQAHWGVDASLSFGRYYNHGAWSESAENSYDGTVGFWLDREDLPSLNTSLNVGHYGANYLVYESGDASDYLKLGVMLDFSKYLTERSNGGERSLKVLYAWDKSLTTSESAGFSASDSSADHTLFIRYSTGL